MRWLAAGKRLENKDFTRVSDLVKEIRAIRYYPSVYEDIHVLAQVALVIQNVAAEAVITLEYLGKNF